MGLFFNYDKPGPGIEKDGPKKKGLFLYFELFWRKLGKLFLSNMLYVALSAPVILAYHFFCFYVLSAIVPAEFSAETTVFNQLVLFATVLLTVFMGTGPVSCGYTFLLRNFAREEHVWMVSDFFALACQLSGVEVMGRDISVISKNAACEAESIRSIISSENIVDTSKSEVRFDIRREKLFIFDRETEERIEF